MVRIKSYPIYDRLTWAILGISALSVLFVAIRHEMTVQHSGVFSWVCATMFHVSSAIYCFALATATVQVTPENVRKEYFGVCITSVPINGIVSAEVSAWGMRRTDSGPYLRLSVIDHDGRSFDFSAPKEKAEDLFRSIVASVRAKEPNQLLRTSQ